MKIFLISCVNKKLDHSARAEDLYISPLFKFNLQFAKKSRADRIFILSAKYGLVPLKKLIDPYNQTLNNMKSYEIKVWADKVIDELKNHSTPEKDHFVFLAGLNYRKFLTPHFKHFEVPMEGLGIGKQLQYLKNHI